MPAYDNDGESAREHWRHLARHAAAELFLHVEHWLREELVNRPHRAVLEDHNWR